MVWKSLIGLGFLLTLAGCATAQSPQTERTPRETVEAVFQAFNRHDAAGMAALYAPDAVLVTSEYCEPIQGRDAVQRIYTDLFAGVPDIQDEVTDVIAEGEKVAVRFVSRSRLPGREFEITFADFFTVRDGMVVRDETIFNFGRPCQAARPASTD